MSGGKLSALQWNILETLAAIKPPFTLTGGGALAGVHLGHRTTRDLDLFWRERSKLDDLAERVTERLADQGLNVSTIQTSQTFHRLQVSDGLDTCLIDLVAEPFAALVPPKRILVAGNELLVDTSREILASKLTTLLSRSELRDLQDVKALLDAGGDLEQALSDAAQKDGGFSPLTLAWVLRSFEGASAWRCNGLESRGCGRAGRIPAMVADSIGGLRGTEFLAGAAFFENARPTPLTH